MSCPSNPKKFWFFKWFGKHDYILESSETIQTYSFNIQTRKFKCKLCNSLKTTGSGFATDSKGNKNG